MKCSRQIIQSNQEETKMKVVLAGAFGNLGADGMNRGDTFLPILQHEGSNQFILGRKIVVNRSHAYTAACCYRTNGHGSIPIFRNLTFGLRNQTAL